MLALLSLTGIRVTALTSLRIKHVNPVEKSVTQNPREVATKFGKHIDTFFVRGFDDAESALKDWMTHLYETLLYGPDEPLFPATAVAPKSNTGLAVDGFERRCWESSEPVRKIVRSAFEAAGFPNYGPHAFRHMLARHAAKTSSPWRSSLPTPRTSVTRTCSRRCAAMARSTATASGSGSL